MQLTQEMAARYAGGQIEVQNPGEEYLYRGEIANIAVEGEGDDATLKITLNWMAKGEGYPPLPKRWVSDPDLYYSASMMIYAVSDIGDGRLSLNSFIAGESVVLFPPDGSKLDPSKVEGLGTEPDEYIVPTANCAKKDDQENPFVLHLGVEGATPKEVQELVDMLSAVPGLLVQRVNPN